MEKDWGQPLGDSVTSVDVRIMYRIGTKAPLGDFPDIADRGNPYFYLHPSKSLKRGFSGPAECPPYVPRDMSNVEIDETELEKKIEQARKEYRGWLGELETDVGSYDVGPIFVAGSAMGGFKNPVNIYFTEEFKNTCRRHKLGGLQLREVINGINPWTGLPLDE